MSAMFFLLAAALTIVPPDCPERGDVVRVEVSADDPVAVPKDAKEILLAFRKPTPKLVESSLGAAKAAGYGPAQILLAGPGRMLDRLRTQGGCRIVGEFRDWPEAFAAAEGRKMYAACVRKSLDKEKVDRFHAAGVKFVAHGVNTREHALRCESFGVDYLETRVPESICAPLAVVKRFSAHEQAVRKPIANPCVTAGRETEVVLPLDGPYAGLEFTPPSVGSVAKIELVTDRKAKKPLTVEMKVKEDRLDFVRGFWSGRQAFWTRPDLRNFSAKGKFVPAGEEVRDHMDYFPRPDEKRHVLEFGRQADGGLCYSYNGNFLGRFVNGKGEPLDGRSLVFRFPEGWRYRVLEKDADVVSPRYEICDFSKNPSSRRFYGWKLGGGLAAGLADFGGVPVKVASPDDGGDVAIAKIGQGEWALEVNPYFNRTARGDFPAEVHFRVPAADYVRAHVLFALDPDPRKVRMMYVRLGHFLGDAGGSSVTRLADTLVACEEKTGLPVGSVRVGTIEKDGQVLPVHRLAVTLDTGRIADVIGAVDVLDLEFLGPVKSGTPSVKSDQAVNYEPDNAKASAFTILGATLERAPVTVRFVQPKGSPGNVFTLDEPVANWKTGLELIAVEPGEVQIGWRAKDDCGQEVFKGRETVRFAAAGEVKTVEIPLGEARKIGLYDLDIVLRNMFVHHAKFCIVPASGRRLGPQESPYGTGDFAHHAVPTDLDIVLPLHAKAGIPHIGGWVWEKHPDDPRLKAFSNSGQFKIMSQKKGKFDAKKGVFGIGEEAVVKDLQEQAKGKPQFDTVLVWHETAPALEGVKYGLPQELVGDPVPPRSEKEEAAAKYVAECARIVGKHFPGKRLQIGNSTSSLGSIFAPLRGGLDPDLFRCWGTECPGQSFMPERASGLNAMSVAKEAAEKMTGHAVELGACHEFTYRTALALGEDIQAAFYMRDVLLCLANGMPMINPANMIDPANVYHHTFWGASGLCARGPTMYPRLAYLAYAVLTKELDGVKFSRQLDTGSSTVYAVEFRRKDGKFVTALWCARGGADLAIPGGQVEGAVSMRGRELGLTAVAFGEEPSYVTSAQPLSGWKIVNCRFPKEEGLYRGAQVIPVSRTTVTNAPGRVIVNENWRTRCPPHFRGGAFALKDVCDAVAGNALEIALDTSVTQYVDRTVCENVALAFKSPVALRTDAKTIGMKLRGDANWGQVFFVIEDAEGKEFTSYKHWGDCFMSDWRGITAVNFDGWGYVHQSLENKKQWVGKGEMVRPLKLKSVIVSRFRHSFGLFGYGKPYENPTLAVHSVFCAGQPGKD